jgi:hypothetical protein
MGLALLIVSKMATLLKKLHLPAFSYPLTFSTFPLIKVNTGRGGAKRGLEVRNTPNHLQVVGKLSNPSWIGWKETKHLIDTDKNLTNVARITEKLNKQCYVDPNENKKYRGKLL